MVRDFTALPKQLDRKFAALDLDAALRPTKIKAGLCWGVARAGLEGLRVKAQIFLAVAAPQSSRPRQALSLSVRALAHFRWLRAHHKAPLVRLYAAGFELLCVASLRMRDAQRALYHTRRRSRPPWAGCRTG